MSPRNVSLVLLAALSGACAPSVRMPVLQPAIVQIPSDVEVIGVIDRSGPANIGEGILGTIEGALTGEAPLGDREGASEALQSVVYVLQESPRFDVVIPNVDARTAQSGLFDTELDYRVVRKICKQAGCDALLALEAFDSDSILTIDGNPIDPRRTYEDPTVSRDTRVLAAWRLYDADEDRILDEARGWTREQSWDQQAETVQDAIQSLPNQVDSIRVVGGALGGDYGRRIAPSWVYVSRSYYGGGDPQLKEAKYYVQAGDWYGAKVIWNDLALYSDPKVSGRANFNLALAYEMEGDLDRALEHAKKAAVELHNKKSRDYVWVIERRIRDQARLEQQLAPAPDKPETHNDVTKPPVHSPTPESNNSNDTSDSGDTPPASGTMKRPGR